MITLQDLGLAYRKAKVDLYYSSHVHLESIIDYEENLHTKLEELEKRINGSDESWVKDPSFIGSWTVAPKSIDVNPCENTQEKRSSGLVFASPKEEWDHICTATINDKKTHKAEFRVMARCSLDFHVLATLWILKVGHLFDKELGECAYGSRLRRTEKGKFNEFSLGSFQPYFKPFRDWRDRGIQAMRTALDEGRKIVALTADIKSFYHELNPDFMTNSIFTRNVLGRELDDKEDKLNRLFIGALQAWAERTPLKKGLPVGLPASAIVANVALIELDRIIKSQVVPIYYGRYVDDILLIMENGANFTSLPDLWKWLFARSNGKLTWVSKQEQEPCFQLGYDNESKICFANEKNKLFILAGETGKRLIDAITHQIKERASEWRAMPRLPQSADYVGTDLLAATQKDGEAADNLRKTSALTMRRIGFAIKLRDFEAYERDLPPEAWKAHRQAFFRAFVDHVLVPSQFFDLAIYLPRVIKLATASEDFADLSYIIDAIEKLYSDIEKHCEIKIKAYPTSDKDEKVNKGDVTDRWKEQLNSSIYESIAAALPFRLSPSGNKAWKKYRVEDKYPSRLGHIKDFTEFEKLQKKLFSFDLAHMPFRFIGLPKEMIDQRGIPFSEEIITNCSYVKDLLPKEVTNGNEMLAKWINLNGTENGLIFSTRPFSLPELFIINNNAYDKEEQEIMKDVVLAIRGFPLNDGAKIYSNNNTIHIPNNSSENKHNISVSSWKTRMESYAASINQISDPDINRYARLCRLLDSVLAQPQQIQYLILPELSLPSHWFMRIARKLHGRGISLIAGIEYLHMDESLVYNQVWASLSHDSFGFPSFVIYQQDKQRPALREEQELYRCSGRRLTQSKPWEIPPIIQHGDFRFALLICSELTNIGYRAALRGKVDALFVPEWNQDTETFSALVESAALDIHAYIIQCNDRQYGDSRIRAPFKDNWNRDILRVKGGITDYCVIGEIDVQALRRFQSCHRSPDAPFKPVPDGFEISPDRRILSK